MRSVSNKEMAEDKLVMEANELSEKFRRDYDLVHQELVDLTKKLGFDIEEAVDALTTKYTREENEKAEEKAGFEEIEEPPLKRNNAREEKRPWADIIEDVETDPLSPISPAPADHNLDTAKGVA